MLGIVIWSLRIPVHVEACKTPHTLLESGINWIAEAFVEEGSKPFPDVRPVDHGGELLVVGTVASYLRSHGLESLVLSQMRFLTPPKHFQNLRGSSQGIQKGPVVEALVGIIGPF